MSVALRGLQFVRVPSYEPPSNSLSLILQGLLVTPGNDLVVVKGSDLNATELRDLHQSEGTFSSETPRPRTSS